MTSPPTPSNCRAKLQIAVYIRDTALEIVHVVLAVASLPPPAGREYGTKGIEIPGFQTTRRVIACPLTPADGNRRTHILRQLRRRRGGGRHRAQGGWSALAVRVATSDQTNPCRANTFWRGHQECLADYKHAESLALKSFARGLLPLEKCAAFSVFPRVPTSRKRIPTIHVQHTKEREVR